MTDLSGNSKFCFPSPSMLRVSGTETKLSVIGASTSHFSAYSLNPKDQVEIATFTFVNFHDRWRLKLTTY